ncbi:major facilitator superfamily domain-containing protein [Dichotomocladium elegans]|nr:major facilitator superfamily domain-containing protein [Dichotomocladium elegans]
MLQSFYMLVVVGVNDGNIGIVIPSIKEQYSLSQSVVSVIFLCMAAGNCCAAVANGPLIRRYNQTTAAIVGGLSLVVGSVMIAVGPVFPIICLGEFFIGFGYALTEAAANVVCGEMPRSTVVLNLLHAFYGAGALVGPLIAAAVLANHSWRVTFMILAGLAAFQTITTERENATIDGNDPYSNQQEEKKNRIIDALRHRATIVAALFLLLYVGTEVTMGGWAYTYLIEVRSSDTVAMAHIVTGYFAGLCAGRLFLAYWTLRFGEKRMTFVYLGVVLATFFIFWFVPAVGASATALVVMGFALGPIYPTTVALAGKSLGHRVFPVAVGFIAAAGSLGSAIFPYVTGVMIGAVGVTSMVPFCLAISAAMLAVWIFIPNPKDAEKKIDKAASIETGPVVSERGISTIHSGSIGDCAAIGNRPVS